MSSTLTIDGKEYVTAVLAGKKFGYTKDYLLMLAKQGKIDGQKIGNRWYINSTSAELFFKDAKKRKTERSMQVREERKLELKKHTRVKRKGYAKAALVETLVIVIIGLSLGATGYIGTSSNVASAQNAEYGFFENFAIAIYEFFSPRTEITESYKTEMRAEGTSGSSSTIEETAISANIESVTHTSLVVAPDEIFTATTIESVENSFSDEVRVSVDPDNPDTGIIIPIFKEREGEAYRFLMVPVHNVENE